MTPASDRAELSTLRAQLDELVERVTKLATRYDDSDDSAVADDLFASERALMTARRTLERATTRLND